MASLSPPLAGSVDGQPHPHPPELEDADYLRQVLGQPDGTNETDIEREMMAKAAALGVEMPISRRPNALDPNGPTGESAGTLVLQHRRDLSTGSNEVVNSRPTSRVLHRPTSVPAELTEALMRKRSRSLSFSQYDKYLSQVDPALDESKFLRPNRDRTEWAAGIVIKSGAKRGVRGLARSITNVLRKVRPARTSLKLMPCICCREDFLSGDDALQTLPCGHLYCRVCLVVMITQSVTDESKMPPRCCTQPIPSSTIKMVLPRDRHQLFLKAVVQYSTPWEARVFCPDPSCGEFIPPAVKPDPKHPFETLCKSCKTRVCLMCKRVAHPPGQDCPEDRELDAVLEMGEKSGWRRCYKCRSLVELTAGCTHITCRCKAEFCYICGAVWDRSLGCPNFCNGEEELERRRVEEEARLAELEAEKLAQEKAAEAEELARREAEKMTMESSEFKALREQQEAEMARFRDYEQRAKVAMRARQSNKKLALLERYSDLLERMRERHAKTEQHLEDRQVLAELELQASLEQKEKKVRLKLRYMELYCRGTDVREAEDSKARRPSVTPKDLEQLREQYCARDGMERRHHAQINGLREKQTKSMEELMERHRREMETLADRRTEEIEDLAVAFANEEEVLLQTFEERKARLEERWQLAIEIRRVEMEKKYGKRFAPMPPPRWPQVNDAPDALAAVAEEAANGDGTVAQ
ncbi:hypothetical protein VTK56DRAFT_2628 [Thermocarpiscus australiensis]